MVPQVHNEQACVVCNEAITNPVCMHCLEEEMTSWVVDYESNLVREVKETTTIFPQHRVTEVKCILCKRDMDICPHCYSKDVWKGLKDPVLADTFVETFNFELR